MTTTDRPLVRVDVDGFQVWQGDRVVPLRARCIRLLGLLIANAGTLVTHEHAMREVWDRPYNRDSHTLSQHVRFLRDALGDEPNNTHYIRTVHGTGYVFNPELVDRSADPPADTAEVLDLAETLRVAIAEVRGLAGQLSRHIEALTKEDE